MEDKDRPGDDALTKKIRIQIRSHKSRIQIRIRHKMSGIRNTGAQKSWTSLEPKDDMEDKDRPGDDALQEEQEPCRQADHGSQTFSSCTQSHRMFLNLVFCIFFLALCTLYNVNAFSFMCGDCHDSSMSSEMGTFLQPYCRLVMTAAFFAMNLKG
jgi:hypothetical protein